jgi:formiminotetrahydrofolate cyclodeaminase
MEVARRSTPLLDLAIEVIEKGNPNAASDGLSAAAVLHASVTAALANVEINLASIKEPDYVETTRFEVERLRTRADEARAGAEAAFTARLAD